MPPDPAAVVIREVSLDPAVVASPGVPPTSVISGEAVCTKPPVGSSGLFPEVVERVGVTSCWSMNRWHLQACHLQWLEGKRWIVAIAEAGQLAGWK